MAFRAWAGKPVKTPYLITRAAALKKTIREEIGVGAFVTLTQLLLYGPQGCATAMMEMCGYCGRCLLCGVLAYPRDSLRYLFLPANDQLTF